MAIVPQQGFPFIVEPLSSERVQLWASYAGQVSTQSGCNNVSDVFGAFWFEIQVDKQYCYILDDFQKGWEQNAIGWMDSMVSSLGGVEMYWSRVVRRMDETGLGQFPTSLGVWYQDARNRLQSVGVLRQNVVGLVMEWCARYQRPFPEHTQAFVQQMQR